MPQPLEILVLVKDYAPVKAVLDAADAVIEAKGDSPWSLGDAIDALELALAKLDTPPNNDIEDDGN